MNQPNPKPEPPAGGQNALEAAAGKPREIIPWWLLLAVFVFVWVAVVWLMGPEFRRDYPQFLARVAQRRGEWDLALERYKRAMQHPDNMNNASLLAEAAFSALSLERYDEAIALYQKAQANRVPPRSRDSEVDLAQMPDFNNMIGRAYVQKGSYDEAEPFLRKALEWRRLDPTANFYLGILLIEKERYREAAEHLKVVARLPGYDERVREYYARIEEKLFAGLD